MRDRGYYSHGTGAIVIPENGDPTLPVHELGHRMEEVNPVIKRSEWAFWHTRTDGEDTQLLRDLKKGSGYEDNERGRADDFSNVYMGKTYGDQPSSAYELLTMGMENFHSGTYHLDADYRQWLLGTLGVL